MEAFSLNAHRHVVPDGRRHRERSRVPPAEPRPRARAWPAPASRERLQHARLGSRRDVRARERRAGGPPSSSPSRASTISTPRTSALARGRRSSTAVAGTRAPALAQELLGDPEVSSISRITALIALGRVRARRGDPGVTDVLDEALERSRGGHLQRLGHVHAARAEAAWLAGDTAAHARRGPRRVRPRAREATPLVRRRARLLAVEVRRARGGSGLARRAVRAADRRRRARRSRCMDAHGCPYEAASALAEGDAEDALLQRSRTFEELGASPAAHVVASRCGRSELPVPAVPEPRRARTRQRSRRASSKCSSSSRRAYGTPRSPSASCSRVARSIITSRRSCASSAHILAAKP